MKTKYENLQIPVLEARISEFINREDCERMEKQIEKTADFVFEILGYRKPDYKSMIHAMIKQHKLMKFYAQCVTHLRRTRNGNNWLAQSRFYNVAEISEAALYSNARDIACEYRSGRFVLDEKL
jgi:hypothetical protein